MAKVLSFETIPHFYWKNDKGLCSPFFVETLFFGRSLCHHSPFHAVKSDVVCLRGVDVLVFFSRSGPPA